MFKPSTTAIGYFGAIVGAMIWGIGPYFFRQLDAYSVAEIIAMRVVFASLLLMVFYAFMRRKRNLSFRAITIPQFLIFGLCAFLLLANWYMFVLAVSIDRIIEAAIGYYIYPLIAACLGMLVLKEQVKPRTVIALVLAFIAVLIKASLLPNFPWIALSVAGSFGLYAILRKCLPVASDTGNMVESFMLLPIGLIYLGWQATQGLPVVFGGGSFGFGMAVLCGLFTITPLLLFHMGNRYLPMSVTGLLFYINPSLQLLIGVWFGEPFTVIDMIVFSLIWIGLIIQFAPIKFRASAS